MGRKGATMGINAAELFPAMGPCPLSDVDGMRAACCALLRSTDPGKNEAAVQCKTAIFARTAFSNLWRASTEGAKETAAVNDRAKFKITSSPASSDWFDRFNRGMHKRMGDKTIKDQAISMELMLALMDIFERDLDEAGNDLDAQAPVLFAAGFVIVGCCASLRGEEIPLMDLEETISMHKKGVSHPVAAQRHAVVPLVGRFKTEIGERHHKLPLALVTKSGSEPGKWVGRMVAWHEAKAVGKGPVFRILGSSDRVTATHCDCDVCGRIEEIQATQPGIVDQDLDVHDRHSMRRSLRRGSDTQALIQRIPTHVVEMFNRWRAKEAAQGRNVTMSVFQSCADMIMALTVLLMCSQGL